MADEVTKDGFLDNGFFVFQHKSGAHRSGIDAILLAATVGQSESGRIADLGAGVGVVGMAAAYRCQNIEADLFEIDEDTHVLSKRSLDLPQNAHLKDRVRAYQADISERSQLLERAGQGANSYGHILSNPPFNDGHYRASPGEKRSKAHVLHPQDPEIWVKSAAHLCREKGKLSLIIRPQNLSEFLPPIEKRFGAVRLLPVQPKMGAAASRLLIGAIKGSRAALNILPSLVLHAESGEFTSSVEEILRGRAGIDLHG